MPTHKSTGFKSRYEIGSHKPVLPSGISNGVLSCLLSAWSEQPEMTSLRSGAPHRKSLRELAPPVSCFWSVRHQGKRIQRFFPHSLTQTATSRNPQR
ncbi:hypothetical protein FKM82_027299 [Ascaphus truei]